MLPGDLVLKQLLQMDDLLIIAQTLLNVGRHVQHARRVDLLEVPHSSSLVVASRRSLTTAPHLYEERKMPLDVKKELELKACKRFLRQSDGTPDCLRRPTLKQAVVNIIGRMFLLTQGYTTSTCVPPLGRAYKQSRLKASVFDKVQ